MKGFKNTTRMQSGFSFPTSAGFTASSGTVREVKPYTRRAPNFAKGGVVKESKIIGDQGNSVVKRGNPPITEFDKQHGGRGDLKSGFAKGGKADTKARGGVVAYAQGGKTISDRQADDIAKDIIAQQTGVRLAKGGKASCATKSDVKGAINRHVEMAKPRGHGVSPKTGKPDRR